MEAICELYAESLNSRGPRAAGAAGVGEAAGASVFPKLLDLLVEGGGKFFKNCCTLGVAKAAAWLPEGP